MGGAVSRATRVFRMYNIDNRVEKVLSKEKPNAAPRFSADQQHLQSVDAESKTNFCNFCTQRSSLY
jgi:hypothetical protein